MMRISDTVKHLIIINVIMFVGTLAISNGAFYKWFALYFPLDEKFQFWQIITHMFMHGGAMHIIFNMFALWMFGSAVEQVLGSKRFLFIYISAGLGAVLLTFAVYFIQVFPLFNEVSSLGYSNDVIKEIVSFEITNGEVYDRKLLLDQINEYALRSNLDFSSLTQSAFEALYEMNYLSNPSLVGASGCIMGVLVAFGMMNPEAKLMMIFLPIPIKAKYFIPGIIILDIVSAITGTSFFSPSNTAYIAHIGGALTGFLIMWYWKKTQFNRNRWD